MNKKKEKIRKGTYVITNESQRNEEKKWMNKKGGQNAKKE